MPIKQPKSAAPNAPTVCDEHINLRVSADLYRAAYQKALRSGGLSAVIRAMLRKFVEGTINFDLDGLADENRRAAKGRGGRD